MIHHPLMEDEETLSPVQPQPEKVEPSGVSSSPPEEESKIDVAETIVMITSDEQQHQMQETEQV